MDLNQMGVSALAGIGLEPVLESLVMQYIPVKLNCIKPAVSWLIAAAWGIGQTALAGGDWQSAVGNTVCAVVVMELKHQSPWGSNASTISTPKP